MTAVRTRFSPSPTGFQHIGGFRTSMYAYLYAKKMGGQFLLRIEDTDRQRTVPGAIEYLIESLQWLGITYDEGPNQAELEAIGEPCKLAPIEAGPHAPYIQSLRGKRYKEVAEQLIKLGVAYRCDCSSERLDQERKEQEEKKEPLGYSGYCRNRNVSADVPHVVRFQIPEAVTVVLNDVVRGPIQWDNPSLRDTILLKSDGMATYHLANVVDDHDMQITHVIRGEEWIATTPVHILLYKALKWEQPKICHTANILGKDGKKLSKRHGANSLNVFRDEGYLPEAIVNYMVRVGWSLGDGDEQEIFTLQELKEKFSLDRLSRTNGTFDEEKLIWTNGVYIRALSDADFTERVRPFFEKAGLAFSEQPWSKLVAHVKERCKLLKDAVPMVEFLFKDDLQRDFAPAIKKDIDQAKAKAIVSACITNLKELGDFSHAGIEAVLRSTAEGLGLKPGPMFAVIRVAVTGTMVSPPLFESMEALGKDKVVKRLEESLALL